MAQLPTDKGWQDQVDRCCQQVGMMLQRTKGLLKGRSLGCDGLLCCCTPLLDPIMA